MELLSALPRAEVGLSAGRDPEIAHVRHDSRDVGPGDLFVAIQGERADGWFFAADAIRRGAVAIVSDRAAPREFAAEVPWILVDRPRHTLALLAARLAGEPARRLVLAGVTGTNGKTTTTMLVASLLEARFGRAGVLSTVGYRTGARELAAPRTTPEATVIQDLLAEMVRAGVPAAAMEVSSHALVLDRVEGCRFDVAVFTNLTPEHLDFHGDMESYYRAKKGLFDRRKEQGFAVVNADDPWGERLAREAAPPVTTFSSSGRPADVRAESIACDLRGVSFEVLHGRGRFRVASPLLGRFQVDNLLAAAAAGLSLAIPEERIASGLASLESVPGRLERVDAGQPFTILVDYAHTEDALERLLAAVRQLSDEKIVLVFGCGGDRDRGKRFPMGRIAGAMADVAIATSDNPRSEDPEAILSEIEAGLIASGATNYFRIADRREAIRTALDLATPGTVVVIAGKGHETTQVIGGRELPFDDRAVARELVARRSS